MNSENMIEVETLNGKRKQIVGRVIDRGNGERCIRTEKGATYEIDADRVFKIRPNSHSQTLIGYIV